MQKSSTQLHVADDNSDLFCIELDSKELTAAIKDKLLPDGRGTEGAVIWIDGDSEVIVEVSRLRLALKPGLLVIELIMAEDDLGEATLVVPYRVGHKPADAVLLAITEQLPRGNPVLSHRWGRITQGLLWETIQAVGRERWLALTGDERFTLCGLYTNDDQLFYLFSKPASAQEVAEYYQQQDGIEGDFDPIPVKLPDQESVGCLLAFLDWIAAWGRGLQALARITLRILHKLLNLIARRN